MGGSDKCYHSSNGNISSLMYYHELYDNARSLGFQDSERVGSVEVIKTDALLPELSEIGIIGISAVVGFSTTIFDEFGNSSLESNRIDRYGVSAGVLLAIHHFNNGDGSVVKDIDGINKRCPIRFVADFYDSESTEMTAIDVFSRQIYESFDSQNSNTRLPSVLFGAYRSAVTVPLAILSSIYEIPHISPLSTSTELDDKMQYRYFSRLIPSDATTAWAAINYLRAKSPELSHLGILYVNDAYGSAFYRAMEEAGQELGISIKGSSFRFNDADEISKAVQTLSKTEYRVFFGIFYNQHYNVVMEKAVEFGIAGKQNVWIVSDGVSESYLNGMSYPTGSNLAIASQGVGILKAEGGREAVDENSGYSRFAKAWYDQNDDAIEYYNCVGRPATNTDKDASIYYQAKPGFFENKRLSPIAGSVFAYDSIVAMGLAACNLHGNNPESYFEGPQLHGEFMKQNFEGASGNVKVDEDTLSRDPSSAFYVIYNVNGRTDKSMTTFSVKTVSYTTQNSTVGAGALSWVDTFEGRSFVYSDGTTKFPCFLPPLEVKREDVRVKLKFSGLILCAIILATTVYFFCWTFINRETRIVKASQPVFLQMILVGTAIMGASIITFSIDDTYFSETICSVCCMVSPWLLTNGFVIIFSALFAKIWRVNKLFHSPRYRRVRVKAIDAILPFVVLFTLNNITLAIWTTLNPLKWERVFLDSTDEFDRPDTTYGTCSHGKKSHLPYFLVISVLNFTMVILANIQAYRARKIATEFSESKYIGIIMASILQACCIGVPVVVVVMDQPSANYIVPVLLVFVICMSMLLLMFVPKTKHLKKYVLQRSNQREFIQVDMADGLGSEDESHVKGMKASIKSNSNGNTLPDTTNVAIQWSSQQSVSRNLTQAESVYENSEAGTRHSHNSGIELSSSISSSSNDDNGYMRVIKHPKMDNEKVTFLREEIYQLKTEKLLIYEKIWELKLLLRNNGIIATDEMLDNTDMNDNNSIAASRNKSVGIEQTRRRLKEPFKRPFGSSGI